MSAKLSTSTSRRNLLKGAGAAAGLAVVGRLGAGPLPAAAEEIRLGVEGVTVASLIDTTNIVQGGSAVFGISYDPYQGTLSPFSPSDSNRLIYEGLISYDPDTAEPMPLLAERWEISPDGTEYTFYLKQGVTWHDGTPFTADDVKATFDIYIDPDLGPLTSYGGYYGAVESIASVEVIDPATVRFTTPEVNAAFMAKYGNAGIAPAHLLNETPRDQIFESRLVTVAPIGTGPFQLSNPAPGEQLELDAYPDYHLGAPALDRVIFRVSPDQVAVYQQLKTGEIDSMTFLEPSFYQDAVNSENIQVWVDDPWTTPEFLAFNLRSDRTTLFQDPRVRQALWHAIDRQTLIETIALGLGDVPMGYSAPDWFSYRPDAIEARYPYDPARARTLLEEAGWLEGDDGVRAKDGQRFSFEGYFNAGRSPGEGYLLALPQFWAEVGVEMTPILTGSWDAYYDVFDNSNFGIIINGYGMGIDPDFQTGVWESINPIIGYDNPRVGELLATGRGTLDPEARTAAYLELENLIVEEAPVAWISTSPSLMATSTRLRNFVPNSVSRVFYHSPHLWYVTDGQ